MEHDLQSKFGRTTFFKNVVFVLTGILAVVGGGNAIFDLYNKWQDTRAPTKAHAIIELIDVQDNHIDRVVINFRNATSIDESINSIGLACERYDGQTLILNALNNEPFQYELMKQSFRLPELDETPRQLASGASVRFEALFYKSDEIEAINKTCKFIRPYWTDSSFQNNIGDSFELDPRSVFKRQSVSV
ncbi:hypothetical protein [Vibrio splendidus]|uniref:hypothetical protein n=1 Tax=Vibrio splendidus TaxID=29497 RepID=UPI000D3382A8|nr:hypothetical protein [Vibrio splendidus]PTP86944.1 hypothetical protein CWO03_12700 [Vibrio splendidus]